MEDLVFISQTLSFLFLLIISSFTYLFSKKINFPYTVLLVLIWLLLVPISKLGIFSFIDDFKLTPEILFYVFLPFLLFEWWYYLNYKNLLSNWKTISWLAIFWLLLSTLIISLALYFFLPFAWLQIPFLVCLLFWSLISATDPVAVLAIFKSLWAPRRLNILFQWESLFNDGTSVTLFVIILWLILEWWEISTFTYFEWIWKFISMVFWWILFWLFTWILFSEIIWKIKNNEDVEIVLTMVLAHMTFIFAELISYFLPFIPISSVISTVIASIVIWNYWKYKITPRVEIHMQKFWEFFSFIANSIVFILMWLILSTIDIDFSKFILPIIITILTVMITRAISIHIPIFILNKFKFEDYIPYSWVTLLSWWNLRWALALMMVLMIPWVWDTWYEKILVFQDLVGWKYSFSIKDILIVLTISSIMFTLFVKAPIIPALMKQLKLDKLNKLEEFKYEEWKILWNINILKKLDLSYKKAYITKLEYDELKYRYNDKLNLAKDNIKKILWNRKNDQLSLIKKTISLHALWIEKQYLKELFFYNEIDEKNFKYILKEIENQIDLVENKNVYLEKALNNNNNNNIFTNFVIWKQENRFSDIDLYIINRTRLIITRKVIKELRLLQEIDFWYDKTIFEDIIELYAMFNKKSDEKRIKLFISHKATINAIESNLINKSLLKLEESVIKGLYQKEIITPKLYLRFMSEIEYEMYGDLKKFL